MLHSSLRIGALLNLYGLLSLKVVSCPGDFTSLFVTDVVDQCIYEIELSMICATVQTTGVWAKRRSTHNDEISKG